ncbi:MAG: glycoside hydrolase family 15 protein, partial [Deltaproteobacteria bacterium]|nr:glycoside hydrolase family 15 protein [Deltaproteobacteria bacterium]
MSKQAPGWPGMGPKWTSSAKNGVGTAVSDKSYVWFTLSHGIINEIYYPGIDQACTRDMGMIVTDGASFFSEEKRHTASVTRYLADGVAGFGIVNTCNQGRYTIYKEIITDPGRNSVLQWTRFLPVKGEKKDYHLYVLIAPHIGNRGYGNNAVVGEYKGVPMLFAYREGTALALACSAGFVRRSAGFVGVSDGWQDLHQHRAMDWTYTSAYDGNTALTGEIDHLGNNGEFVLSIGFGRTTAEAGNSAISSLLKGFATCRAEYKEGWTSYQERLIDLHSRVPAKPVNVYRTSTAVLKTHETKGMPGALIASLSIPWGQAMGDDDIGGYHLIWPRDLVETAGGFLAAGDHGSAREVLFYLMTVQEADGHWPQNMWRDGTSFWGGIQLDETAFPILLAGMLRREGALGTLEPWDMIEKASGFILRNGPVTQQDRWEEDPGYSPFTLAVEISALIVAAEFAEQEGHHDKAAYMRETADMWNASIERWVYVENTELARRLGVDGYYVRIAPPETSNAGSPLNGYVPIKNRPYGENLAPADNIISTDFLAFVRFGLRSAGDPRILNTLKVVDAGLKVETPYGTSWHRYSDAGVFSVGG